MSSGGTGRSRASLTAIADWVTISSLATAGGTLVLAVATFGAVRSSNRSARIAEAALHEQRRPILSHSRLDDPLQKIGFADGHWVRVEGGHAAAEHVDGRVYLAMSLRNVGAGIAVLYGWSVWHEQRVGRLPHREPEEFRMTTRDLLIPPNDVGLWQGAIRDRDDDDHGQLARNIDARNNFAVDLMYGDSAGERWISRFGITAVAEDQWLCSVVRHWNLDGADFRERADES